MEGREYCLLHVVSIHPETLVSMARRNTVVESGAIGQIPNTLTIG